MLFIRSGSKGKHLHARLFDPMGNKVYEAKRVVQRDSAVWLIKKTVAELTSESGSGTYRSAFDVDGEYVGGSSFELVGRKRGSKDNSN